MTTRLRPPPSALLLALVLALPALAAEPDPRLAELRRLTEYDAKAPLDVKPVRTRKHGDVTVTELTYASPRGGRVPAYLVTPAGRGPFPAVLFQHWGLGTKNAFLDEARSLARAGVVSLLVDAPHVRPAPWTRSASAPDIQDTFPQLMVDLRRGVDLLTSRPQVDGKRLGYVGHSLGATVGGALSGVEPRLRAVVLMAGIGEYSRLFSDMGADRKKKLVESLTQERFDAFLRNMESLDGVVGVRNATAPLFFQYSRSDEWVTYAQARAYIDAAREPKLSKF